MTTIVLNDAYEPVRTSVKDAEGKDVSVIIPGKGWRVVAEAERTDDLNSKIANGVLRVWTV